VQPSKIEEKTLCWLLCCSAVFVMNQSKNPDDEWPFWGPLVRAASRL